MKFKWIEYEKENEKGYFVEEYFETAKNVWELIDGDMANTSNIKAEGEGEYSALEEQCEKTVR